VINRRTARITASVVATFGIAAASTAQPAYADDDRRTDATTSKADSLASVLSPDSLRDRFGLDPSLAEAVAGDLRIRSQLDFSVDPQLAVDLRTGKVPASTDVPEIPLTPSEADEFFQRQALEQDAQILNDALSSGELSEYYAGQFIDHRAGGKLVVNAATAEGAKAIQGVLDGGLGRQLPHQDRVVVREVGVSKRDLLTAQQQVADSIQKDPEGAIASAYIDEQANSLVVGIDPEATPERRAKVEELVKSLKVPSTVEDTPRFVDTNGTLRDDSSVPPYSGGHGYVATASTQSPPPGGGVACTFGFKVNWSAYPSNSFLLSAGHCWTNAPIDAKAYYNWYGTNGGSRTAVGATKGYYITNQLDLSLVQMGTDTAPKIIIDASSPNQYRGITRTTAYAPAGITVCHVGSMSDTTHCGTIAQWANYRQRILVNASGVIGGDSGGPLYVILANQKAEATGITATSSGSQTESTNTFVYLSSFCNCSIATE